MSFHVTHELHHRRFGRNLGLGLVLGTFVAIVFGLTIVKVSRGDFSASQVPASQIQAPQGQASE